MRISDCEFRRVLFRSDLSPRLGLRAEKISSLYNGAIPCKLLRFEIAAAPVAVEGAAPIVEAADDFANRMRKNLKHLGKWAKRADVNCWRVYDADLPEYAVAVDLYETVDGEQPAPRSDERRVGKAG